MEVFGSIFMYMKEIPEDDPDSEWANPPHGYRVDNDEYEIDPVHSGMRHVDIIIGALG